MFISPCFMEWVNLRICKKWHKVIEQGSFSSYNSLICALLYRPQSDIFIREIMKLRQMAAADCVSAEKPEGIKCSGWRNSYRLFLLSPLTAGSYFQTHTHTSGALLLRNGLRTSRDDERRGPAVCKCDFNVECNRECYCEDKKNYFCLLL